jgi:hypothetical protein
LSKVESIVELLRTYRGGKPNSLILGGPLGWSWQATLDTTHHGSLAGPANAHRHSDLANIGIDDHHARDHATRHAVGGGDQVSLDASQIGSGTFGVARGGTGLSSIAAGGILYASAADTLSRIAPSAANQVLRSTGANALQIAALVAADIPSLDASKITSGRFGMARMPDGTSGYYLKAQGSGVDPTYAAISGLPTIVRKTADETVNNSTTLQNDDELLFAVAANEVWQVDIIVRCISGGTPDIKFAVTVPSGGSLLLGAWGCDTIGNKAVLAANLIADYSFAAGPKGATLLVVMRAIVINGATAGNVQLQWAQNTKEASDTKVLANSCIIAHKLN